MKLFFIFNVKTQTDTK